MNRSTSTENARPWWADVAHLRDDAGTSAPPTSSILTAPAADDPFLLPGAGRQRERPSGERPPRPVAGERTRRPARSSARAPRRDAVASDWFAEEARDAGRRAERRPEVLAPPAPRRPRATLVDVAPEHVVASRTAAGRRASGERPTVTITGRPDAALPPQVAATSPARGRRVREQASALLSSPDRMILWAVALGLLMILASIGTASADAATTLTLLP